jgi:hypothetical protein
MGFVDENARSGLEPWWMVEIEGLRKRYGTLPAGVDAVFDGWNPADTGTNQHVAPNLARPPVIGGSEADPLNGTCQIPAHTFALLDRDDSITELLAVSDTPKALSYLTANITKDQAFIPVLDFADFAASGELFVGRETIAYTTKQTRSGSYTCSNLAGQTADAGSTAAKLVDAARTEDEDYWTDAVVGFTSGANNGLSRRVVRSVGASPLVGSPFGDDETANTIYFDPQDPFPNAIGAGDTYYITQPKHRVYVPAIPGATDDYWEGAQVAVTVDSANPLNVGEIRYVKSFDASANTLEFYEPLPGYTSGVTQFDIVRYAFTVCTRGMYRSEAKAHDVIDTYNAVSPVPVSDAPRFIKTRRCWIHEYRRGCAEADADHPVRVGVIRNWGLEDNGRAWRFDVDGLLALPSQNVLTKQKRGKIALKHLWGGRFKLWYVYANVGSGSTFTDNAFEFAMPVMSDGTQTNFSVTEIYYESADLFPADGANIKIGNEVIHYTERTISPDLNLAALLPVMKLGEHVPFDNIDDVQSLAASNYKNPDQIPVMFRGMFGEKISIPQIQHDWTNDGWPAGYSPPVPPNVNALMDEHFIGDEILQVMLCEDSPNSDFPRYDQLEYSGSAGALGTLPQTVTGGRSGVTATIRRDNSSPDHLLITGADGDFQVGETITSGAWSATVVEHLLGDGKDLPPRNNPITVFLQLLCSTGDGSNGPYDTLPDGWGISFDQDLVDVAGLELLRDQVFPKTAVDFILHEATSLMDWAQKHLFKFMQVFPLETVTGKLSLAYLHTEAEAQAIDEDDPLTEIDAGEQSCKMLPGWNSGSLPVAKVEVKYNKHPTGDDYYGTLEINFQQTRDWYQEHGRTIKLECACLYVPNIDKARLNPADPQLPELVARMVNPMWSRFVQHPAPIISATIKYRNIDLQVGQLVKLTHEQLPNLRTGQRGLSGEYCQVIGMSPSAGSVGLTLWQIGVHDNRYGRKCPSAMVYSYAADTPGAGKSTVTLYNNVFSQNGETDAAKWKVGDKVMFLTNAYVPAGGGATPEVLTIESVGASSVVLTSNATNAPAQGYVMEVAYYDQATSTRQTTRVFQADEDRTLGAGGASAYKYQ